MRISIDGYTSCYVQCPGSQVYPDTPHLCLCLSVLTMILASSISGDDCRKAHCLRNELTIGTELRIGRM